MKDKEMELNINNNTTLWPPDTEGDIAIDMWTEESGNNLVYVSFEVLKKWVSSMDTTPCVWCATLDRKGPEAGYNFCHVCGRALSE